VDIRADGISLDLSAFVRANRGALASRWEHAARALPPVRDLPQPALLDCVAPLIDEVANVADDLLAGREPNGSPESRAHALDRIAAGHDIGEVVAELAVLRECVLDFVDEEAVPLDPTDRRILDRAIDRLIATIVAHLTRAQSTREHTLLESSERARARERAILESAIDAIVVMDHEGRIVVFNPSAERIFGYRAADVMGRELATCLVPLRFRERHRTGLARHVAGVGGQTVVGKVSSFPAMRADGSEFSAEIAISRVDGAGPPLFAGHIRDISDRERTERAEHFLSEATKVLGASLDATSALADVAKAAIPEFADALCVDVATNGVFERLAWAHRSPHEHAFLERLLMADPPRALPGPLIAEAIRTGKSALVADAGDLVQQHMHASTADANLLRIVRPTSLVVVPLASHEQRLGALTFCFSDSGRHYDHRDARLFEKVAYRAANALENARLYQEAKRAIANRDEILGVVAHDLKSPLSTIVLGAQVLTSMDSYAGKEAAVRGNSALIHRAAARMHRLICDLLDLASIQAGRLKVERMAMDPARLVNEVVESFCSSAAEKHIELTQAVDPALPPVLCDHDRIIQTLSNLVDNALKSTPTGGKVQLTGVARDRNVVLSVSDTGSGIAKEDVGNVFLRYWRGTHAGYAGTGRGLAIAKAVVEAHDGELWAESELGVGSTFSFSLPRA
jgi:PAS domain S-box-containing protein